MSVEDTVTEVLAAITPDGVADLVSGLVDIPSPTGAERPLAEWAAAHMAAAGVQAHAQVVDEYQANAVGVLRGAGAEPSLLLYAPIDTFTTGDPAVDLPWAAPTMRADMLPRAQVHGDLITGLAAGNPKGHAAAIMLVIEALARLGITPPGDLVIGLGAGGMPSFSIPGVGVPGRQNTGHGVGATFLLERGFHTDRAVIAKPGWNVSHEEVGLVWIDVEVPGEHTYVGSRHRLPYQNPATLAAAVTTHLEAWFEEYAAAHETGTMRPQGIVSSVVGGDERLAAATSALVKLRLDVRLTPDQTPPDVVREVLAQVRHVAAELDVEVNVRQVAAVPGTRTDPDHEIVRRAVRAWEAVAGRKHEPIGQNSGATDANIIRMRGIPTARVGMPKVLSAPDGGPVDFTLGMNIVSVAEVRRLAEVLTRIVLDSGPMPDPRKERS